MVWEMFLKFYKKNPTCPCIIEGFAVLAAVVQWATSELNPSSAICFIPESKHISEQKDPNKKWVVTLLPDI